MALNNFAIDLTQQVTVATSSTNATLTVPVDKIDGINRPNNIGSYWFICNDGVPVAINYNAPAVFASSPKIEVGSYLTTPLQIPPGTVINLITSASAGSFSIIRARYNG